VLVIGGPGYRLGLWDLGFGLLGVFRYALYLGAAAAASAILFLLSSRWRSGQVGVLLGALALGALVAAAPVYVRSKAQSLPFIHDITTDTVEPPAFVAVLPLRDDAPNPPQYAGPEVAAQQRAAYPDLQSLDVALAPDALFQTALDTVRQQGWEIIAAVGAQGRIEATDTTFWYGFKDDVVIRIRPTTDGSRLDIRSKSRVGASDLGVNAARIRAFLTDLRQRLD